jgi:hypothetical protein
LPTGSRMSPFSAAPLSEMHRESQDNNATFIPLQVNKNPQRDETSQLQWRQSPQPSNNISFNQVSQNEQRK